MAKKKISKDQLDLKLKIKEAEKKAREEQVKTVAKEKPVKKEADSKAISFDKWWIMLNRRMKIQAYMKEVLRTDFKARGAKKEETEERYYELLKLFGYKL